MTEVTIYSSRYCGYCSAAKSLLGAKGVPYKEILMDSDPELRQDVMQRSRQRTVPQIWVGDTHVGGFTDLQGMDRTGKLDKLLEVKA